MPEAPAPAAARRAALRAALGALTPPCEVVAEDVLGQGSRIDLVAREPDGGVIVVLVAAPGGDLVRLADGLAQLAWLEPRLPDWLKLAPGLGLDLARPARLWLVAAEFEERTRLAALRAGGGIRLLRAEGLAGDVPLRLATPGSPAEGAAAAAGPEAAAPARSVFRTRLREDDLAPRRRS